MASLLSLPPEIFNAVLEDVDGEDVLHLRRVNRRISALSTHQFGLKCLADLSSLCVQDSLKGLLELIAHPLGRYIKRLTISTHVDWEAEEGEISSKIASKRPEVLAESLNDEKHTVLLVQALKNLNALGTRPVLGIYDPFVPWTALDETNSGRERRGYGFGKFYGDVKIEPTMCTEAWRAVKVVLDAVEQAGYPLGAFYAHLDNQRRREDGADKDCFASLRERFISPAFWNPNPDVEVIYNSFNSNANLNLQLRIDNKGQKYELLTLPTPERDWLRHPRMSLVQREGLVPGVLNMPHHFQQLRLALVDTSVSSLINLLRSQADTLRILHLEYVTINLFDEEEDADNEAADPDATGLNVLLFLKDELELDYLRMNRVSNSRDQSRLIGGHDDTWTIREEIQDGLQMYIQREENDEHSVDEEFSDDDEGEWISVHHSEDEDQEPEDFEGPR